MVMKTERKVFKQKGKLPEDLILQEELVIPEELPVLPLLDTVIYPQMVTALGVSTERELKLLDYVLTGNRLLALALQKNPKEKEAGPHDAGGEVRLQKP